jgi:hypothetical protein
MLRPGKFTRIEAAIAWIFGFLLFAAGLTGAALAFTESNWRLGAASIGAIGIGILYILAALRRRPL